MNTLDLEQAAAFLRLHPNTVQARAKAGIIPGSKPGRRWVFRQDELEAYFDQCRSTSAGGSGGFTTSTTGTEFAAQVEQVTGAVLNKYTTKSRPNSGKSNQADGHSTAR